MLTTLPPPLRLRLHLLLPPQPLLPPPQLMQPLLLLQVMLPLPRQAKARKK